MQGLVESVGAGWGYWGKMGGGGRENGLILRVEKGGGGAKR